MAGIKPNYSLSRDGRLLLDWLWLLVDEDRKRRLTAGEALQAMDWGLPSVHTDFDDLTEFPDMEQQQLRFATGVRAAVNQPDFDTAEFVRRLGAYLLAVHAEWARNVSVRQAHERKRHERYDRIADRLVETINDSSSDRERQRALERFARLSTMYICGGCEDDVFTDAEAFSTAAISAGRVLESLADELLAAPEVLEQLLNDRTLRSRALDALVRIGPAASEFIPILLTDLDRVAADEQSWGFDGARALGAVARGNPDVVEAMVQRLQTKCSRMSAASVLQHMGPDVAGRQQEIVDLLLPMVDAEQDLSFLLAYAAVGCHLPTVREKVIGMARPRPTILVVAPAYPDHHYDPSMAKRGIAISAMVHFTDYTSECVPVLIDAMSTFEEFDPDECYDGPHGRIAYVLAAFGKDAGSAAAPLAAHLMDDPGESPTRILDTLAAMGSAAAAALPALHAFHQHRWQNEQPPNLDVGPVDRDDDHVGWVIQQIAGRDD